MTVSVLPAHGPISCRACWQGRSDSVATTSDGAFRIVNDPGAWGSSNPEILVLGISKGFTQASAFSSGDFDSVPFKGCRPRLRQSLAALGLMAADQDIDAALSATETRYGWGSLVRCSLSGWNAKKQEFGAGTPDVLPAFRHAEAQRFLSGCMNRFLARLPARTQVVVLLGNDDRYINTVGDQLRSLHANSYERLNAVAHRAGGRLWVHSAHPSRGNGHFEAFLTQDTSTRQGLKRELARQAVLSHLNAKVA